MGGQEAALLWLRHVIEQDLAVATVTGAGGNGVRAWHVASPRGKSWTQVIGTDGQPVGLVQNQNGEHLHVTLHDPRSVVDDCQAKLGLLDFCERVIHEDGNHVPRSDGWAGLGVARFALGCVAYAYRHREGYAEHWERPPAPDVRVPRQASR
jgi:hypothetical protein